MVTKKEEWKARVGQCKDSGLSAAAWCRENRLDYNQFLYWRGRLAHTDGASFAELTDASSGDSGVALEVGGATIKLARAFDSATLLSCLKLLAAC